MIKTETNVENGDNPQINQSTPYIIAMAKFMTNSRRVGSGGTCIDGACVDLVIVNAHLHSGVKIQNGSHRVVSTYFIIDTRKLVFLLSKLRIAIISKAQLNKSLFICLTNKNITDY